MRSFTPPSSLSFINGFESGINSDYVFTTDTSELYYGSISAQGDILVVSSLKQDTMIYISSLYFSEVTRPLLYQFSFQVLDSKLSISRSLVEYSAAVGLYNLNNEVCLLYLKSR